MRTYLVLFVALALLSSYGCSGKSKPTRVSQNTDSPASADQGTSRRPGMAGGPGASADPSQDEKAKGDEKDESEEDEKESSEDEKDESEESASEDRAKAPPKRFDPTKRRRKGRPGMAGGAGQATPPPETKSGNSKAGDSEEKEEEKEEPEEEEKEPEEKVVTLYDRAVKAFSRDHETEAFQFLYAHYLTDEDALKSHPPKWFDGVKEPRVALRWGIGVIYSDGGYDGEPPVIGDPVDDGGSSGSGGNNRAGNSGRRGGGGGGDFGNSGGGGMTVQGGKRRRSTDRRSSNPSNQNRNNNSEPARLPSETLEYYTGDFGSLFVKRYQMRLPRKFYGSIMHAVSESAANGDDEGEAEKEDSRNNQSQQLPGGGDFGTMGGNSMAPPRNNRNGRNNDQNSDEDYEADPTSLAPGLMMVGVGNKKQLLENAKSLNLDVLAIFEVKVKHSERRNGDTSTKSNTRLSLYSVKTGEAIDTDSKSLSNRAVASAREKDNEDPVELELDKVFTEMADDKFKAKDLPASLNSDIATKRYDFLLSKKHANPLPILVEIKYYVDDGLISKNQYFAACEQLLGDVEAQDLIDGNLKQKERALEEYLPGNYEVNMESGSEENFR